MVFGGRSERAPWCTGGPLLAATLLAALVAFTGASRAAEGAAPARESDGRLLVLNQKDGTLMVFDEPSHALLATVPVGREPREVVATLDGRKAYVVNGGDPSLSVVDLLHYKVERSLRPDQLREPRGLAVSPGRGVVLTSGGSHRLFLLDAARDVVERVITTNQSGAGFLALTHGGDRAWVANRGSDSVSLVEIPSLKTLKTLPVGPAPEGVAASSNGRWVVVALQGAGQVAILDTSRTQVVTRLPAGQAPSRVACAPKAPLAVVTNRLSDDVSILDIAGRHLVATVPVGRCPGGVAINTRGTKAYVANSESNSVSIVSLPGYEVTGQIPTGAGPEGIAFVPPPAAPSPPRATRTGRRPS